MLRLISCQCPYALLLKVVVPENNWINSMLAFSRLVNAFLLFVRICPVVRTPLSAKIQATPKNFFFIVVIKFN